MMHRAWSIIAKVPYFFKVIYQISRSHGTKYHLFRAELGVSGLWLQFDSTDGYEMMHKAWCSIGEVPYIFEGHPSNFKVTQDIKNRRFLPELGVSGLQLPFGITDGFKMKQKLDIVQKIVLLFFTITHQVSRSHRLQNRRIASNFSNITRSVAAFKSLRFASLLCHYTRSKNLLSQSFNTCGNGICHIRRL